MSIQPRQTLLAAKAVSLAPGLNATDRQVALILIEHFNRKTGRCDPSLTRIASLLGVSPRSVMRANKRRETAGLIRKVRHGGHHQCNRYEPNWQKLHALNESWQQRFAEVARMRAPGLSLERRQPRHLRADNDGAQTSDINLLKEPETIGTVSSPPPAPVGERCGHGHSRKTLERPFGTQAVEASRVAAERRWNARLNEAFASTPVTYGEILEAITPEIQHEATEAELRRHGGGFALVVEKLRLGAVRLDACQLTTVGVSRKTAGAQEQTP